MLSDFLSKLIACPVCKGELAYAEDLGCERCARSYSLGKDGIPSLLRKELLEPMTENSDWHTVRKQGESAHFSSITQDYAASMTVLSDDQAPYAAKVRGATTAVLTEAASASAILDIGGCSWSHIRSHQLTRSTVMMDISYEWLRSVRSTLQVPHAVAADCEELPFANGSFDLVLVNGVIHHVPRQRLALDEIGRVLKPGGTAIIIEPAKWSVAFVYYIMKRIVLFLTGTGGLKKYLNYHGSPYESYVAPRLIKDTFNSPNYRVEIVKSTPLRLPYLGGWGGSQAYFRMLNRVEHTWLNDAFGSYLIATIKKLR